MAWTDLEWTPVPGLPTPQSTTPPPFRPLLPPSVEKEAKAAEALEIRLVKTIVWCGTGLFIVLIVIVHSLLTASAAIRWQLSIQLGLLVAPILVVLCRSYVLLRRGPSLGKAAQQYQSHVNRYLEWRHAHRAWLAENRRKYRQSLTFAQRLRLEWKCTEVRERP